MDFQCSYNYVIIHQKKKMKTGLEAHVAVIIMRQERELIVVVVAIVVVVYRRQSGR